jgi:hypothetical protein
LLKFVKLYIKYIKYNINLQLLYKNKSKLLNIFTFCDNINLNT